MNRHSSRHHRRLTSPSVPVDGHYDFDGSESVPRAVASEASPCGSLPESRSLPLAVLIQAAIHYLHRGGLLVLFIAGLIMVFNPFARATTAQQPDQARIAAGRKIFAGACSNSYCHGSEGTGGGGPKLQNRNLTAEYVTRVINEGVKGTNMPSFKGVYSREEIASLVAYVLSLSANKAGAAV